MTNSSLKNPRIAWLFPSLSKGSYWHPIFSEFSRKFENTIIYTGYWPGFSNEYKDKFNVKIVGKIASLKSDNAAAPISFVSPSIIYHLILYRPHIIFTSGFSLWTIFALILKLWMRWKVVILYDGSTPSVDRINSAPHIFIRRIMSRFTDAFNANNNAAKEYLTSVLYVRESKVFLQPYLVPDPRILLTQKNNKVENKYLTLNRPIFMYVGDITYKKGIQSILEACCVLKNQQYDNFTIIFIGEGAGREELTSFAKTHNIDNHIIWTGWINYEDIGTYFKHGDVFVFPSFDDVWGMVVSEAMLLGKPIVCSKRAGVSEIIIEGENGYLFDPQNSKELADSMQRFIDNPNLIVPMGEKSQQLIAKHTPQEATKCFVEVVSHLLKT